MEYRQGTLTTNQGQRGAGENGGGDEDVKDTDAAATLVPAEDEETPAQRRARQQANAPFQRLDFVVRVWQNFEDEDDTEGMLESMGAYLEQMVSEHVDAHSASDLNETRSQIHTCFREVGCFLLPHPGFAVTKKDYSGDMSLIR